MTRWFSRCLALVLIALCSAAQASGWTLQVDDASGLPQLMRRGTPALSPSWSYWGPQWSWADFDTRLQVQGPQRYLVQGRSQRLGLGMQAQVTRTSPETLRWEFTFDAARPHADVIGGGIIFRLDLDGFGAELGEPVLLPGQQGWRWGRAGGPRIELAFEPGLPELGFERGNKGEIRAYFQRKEISAGQRKVAMTVTVAGGVAIGPANIERYGAAQPSRWPLDPVDTRQPPVDLSFLNAAERPAGKRGFVQARGDRLVHADGTTARFWGTNVNAWALFDTPRDAVREQARRLSALGYNLVRIHHHDSFWVQRNIFGEQATIRDTGSIDATQFDRIGWWVKCLKDEGIHVWLDLHVQRAFKPGDGISAFAEINKPNEGGDPKGYGYVNPSIQQAMKRFAEAYVTRVNPHTGLAFKDDPAVAGMLITNENDLTHHTVNMLLPDKRVPEHTRWYMAEAEAFAKAQGLPLDKVWQSWVPGASKLFLNDLERRMGADMVAHLRGLGVKVPLVTTSTWGANPMSSLPALTAGDLIDVHAYAPQGQIDRSPATGANLAHWLAAGQVLGRPMSVTEWNAEPFPTPDRHVLPLYIGAVAAHQGWDAMMHFAYAQSPVDGPGQPSNWHSFNDPSMLPTLAAAALMYRRGDVRLATTRYVFDPGMALFDRVLTPSTAPAVRTAMEIGHVEIAMPQASALPWLQRTRPPEGATVLTDPDQRLIGVDATEARSDTGELLRQWDKGLYRIDTPRTQAAMGWLGGQDIRLKDVQVRLSTPHAAVAVQALDDQPIASSRRLLITLAARSVPQEGNRAPFHVEPVEGELLIRAPQGLQLYRGGLESGGGALPVSWADGVYRVVLDGRTSVAWLQLRP